MDAEQFEKIQTTLNRIAAATLATGVMAGVARKPTLKEVQAIFDDCLMIVDPAPGTDRQAAFQARLDKKEW